MSVRLADNIIFLDGRCGAEDAEALLLALQDAPGYPVDVSGVVRLHMAVVQILLIARPAIRGTSTNSFLARHLTDLLQ